MCAAVDLDNELALKRDEVNDVACDRVLASKLPSRELPPS
jgi:hypothetical protein